MTTTKPYWGQTLHAQEELFHAANRAQTDYEREVIKEVLDQWELFTGEPLPKSPGATSAAVHRTMAILTFLYHCLVDLRDEEPTSDEYEDSDGPDIIDRLSSMFWHEKLVGFGEAAFIGQPAGPPAIPRPAHPTTSVGVAGHSGPRRIDAVDVMLADAAIKKVGVSVSEAALMVFAASMHHRPPLIPLARFVAANERAVRRMSSGDELIIAFHAETAGA